MTIYKKGDAEEKKDSEKETDRNTSQVPKVVVEGEERHISNSGWVPMEGGNFDRASPRPKEKRSSSFGPLSIIRLSPSPLARTPSPSLPEYENYENTRRFRSCTRLAVFFCLLAGFLLATGFFIYQRGLIKSAYKRGIYHGWNQATFSNKGVAEKLEQNVEISPNDNYEKIDVPRFGGNRPAVFLHDFKQNLTAIVDVLGKRCFVKELDKSVTAPPAHLIDMLQTYGAGKIPKQPRVIRETFRVGEQLSQEQIDNLGSFMIARHCSYRPVYLLEKTQTTRVKRTSEPEALQKLEFASLGGDNVEVDVILI